MGTQTARKWLSKKRALFGALLGQRTGFFTQYAFMDSVRRIERYPAIEALCRAADIQPILDALAGVDASDEFWFAESRHLGPLDAVLNFALVSTVKPKRIIEIGSGRSTHILARAAPEATITCIDPNPQQDIETLPVVFERRTLKPDDAELAAQLEAGDILYIDSSHILQPGTDVDIELNLMFPALKPGVVVHVHDVFLPWGYPVEWDARNWNEVSGLIPWIASGAFEIVLPSYFVAQTRAGDLRVAVPAFMAHCPNTASGGFWLRKRGLHG